MKVPAHNRGIRQSQPWAFHRAPLGPREMLPAKDAQTSTSLGDVNHYTPSLDIPTAHQHIKGSHQSCQKETHLVVFNSALPRLFGHNLFHHKSNTKNVVQENMNEALTSWSLSAGCADTHTPLDRFQNLTFNDPYSSNRLPWHNEAFTEVPKERLLATYFTCTKHLMVFVAFAYPFPHLILKQFARYYSGSEERYEWTHFCGGKKKPILVLFFASAYRFMFTWTCQLRISGQKQRVRSTYVRVCVCPLTTVTKMSLKASVTWEVAV